MREWNIIIVIPPSCQTAYQAEIQESEKKDNSSIVPLVDWKLRLMNHIIDSILLFILIPLYWSLLSGLNLFEINNLFLGLTLMIGLPFFLYYFVLELSFQKTVGKFFSGTKVVDENGKRATWQQLFGRTLMRFFPFEWISGLFNNNELWWHDELSRTRVILDKEYQTKEIDHSEKVNLVNLLIESRTEELLEKLQHPEAKQDIIEYLQNERQESKVIALFDQLNELLSELPNEAYEFSPEEFLDSLKKEIENKMQSAQNNRYLPSYIYRNLQIAQDKMLRGHDHGKKQGEINSFKDVSSYQTLELILQSKSEDELDIILKKLKESLSRALDSEDSNQRYNDLLRRILQDINKKLSDPLEWSLSTEQLQRARNRIEKILNH